MNQNRNLKVQRWSIALAEMGAKIKHQEGGHNVKADTLSCLKPATPEPAPTTMGKVEEPDDEIIQHYLDIEGMVLEDASDLDLEDACKETVGEIHHEGDPGVPWDFDGLEITKLRSEQQEMEEYEQGIQGQSNYVIDDGLLYTLRPPPGKTAYPRLVITPSACFRVIRRAHQELGHQGMRKTLEMPSICAKLLAWTWQEVLFPLPVGKKCILTLIDYCTGWLRPSPYRPKMPRM